MNKIVILYQTHQVLTIKNSLTEMDHQLRKKSLKTKQHTSKQHREITNTRTKSKSRKFKENYERGKDYLTITKKHRMKNNQDRNGKIYQVLTYKSTNNITELNEVIYA